MRYWTKSLRLEVLKHTHHSSKGWRRTPEPHPDTQSLSPCLRSLQTFSHSREKRKSTRKSRSVICFSFASPGLKLKRDRADLTEVCSPSGFTGTAVRDVTSSGRNSNNTLARTCKHTGRAACTAGNRLVNCGQRLSANEGQGWGAGRRAVRQV